MTDQLISDLQGAREIVRGHWHKGALSDGHGNFCAVGAIRQSITGQPTVTMATPELSRVIAAESAVSAKLTEEHSFSIADFNDAPATVQQDVLNLFDKALAELGGLA